MVEFLPLFASLASRFHLHLRKAAAMYEKEKTATFNTGRPAGLFIQIVLPNATSSLCEYAKARSFSNGFLHRVYCPVGKLLKTNSKFAPKKNWAPIRLPTIDFQGRTVSFSEGRLNKVGILDLGV